MARLDRACATHAWIQLYNDALVRHLEPNTSDHIPLLLEVGKDRRRPRAMFRFLNYWTDDENYLSLIDKSWIALGILDNDPCQMTSLDVKLKRASVNLQDWQQKTFKYLDAQIEDLQKSSAYKSEVCPLNYAS